MAEATAPKTTPRTQLKKGTQPSAEAAAKEKPVKDSKAMLAAVRIRGMVNVNTDIASTMRYLHLQRKNSCVLLEKNPSNLGMMKKAKDYITFGEIDDATFKLLVEKRGEEYKGRE
ncbi:uL30 family ribosomal protein, partial [Candidatus Woesearchaeota archaeon]|nr:uL30 family ribosomal protein [Candidatus Woesearchaeota archaeon]